MAPDKSIKLLAADVASISGALTGTGIANA
jgi:hypothetical protein